MLTEGRTGNLFGVDYVLLECGHRSRSYGDVKAVCPKCKQALPPDSMADYGYTDSKKVPVSEHYEKNFTAEELSARSDTTQQLKGGK